MHFSSWVSGSVALAASCVAPILGFEALVFVVDVSGALNMDHSFLWAGPCLVTLPILEGVVPLDAVCLRDDKGWLGLGTLMNTTHKGTAFEKLDYLVVQTC